VAISVLPSEAKTYVICGDRFTVSSVGNRSKVSAPALAARPDIATAGNAAAATTTPARSPQISSDAAFAKML
jgi:hypothetical protein